MNKIQIEIQQEGGGSGMLQRFHQVYQAVMDQMSYVQQIVGFMDFDQEAVTGGAAPGTAGLAESPQAATFEEVA